MAPPRKVSSEPPGLRREKVRIGIVRIPSYFADPAGTRELVDSRTCFKPGLTDAPARHIFRRMGTRGKLGGVDYELVDEGEFLLTPGGIVRRRLEGGEEIGETIDPVSFDLDGSPAERKAVWEMFSGFLEKLLGSYDHLVVLGHDHAGAFAVNKLPGNIQYYDAHSDTWSKGRDVSCANHMRMTLNSGHKSDEQVHWTDGSGLYPVESRKFDQAQIMDIDLDVFDPNYGIPTSFPAAAPFCLGHADPDKVILDLVKNRPRILGLYQIHPHGVFEFSPERRLELKPVEEGNVKDFDFIVRAIEALIRR